MDLSDLPAREGARPITTGREIPHDQLDQFSPAGIREDLVAYARALPGVELAPSRVSEPGSLAFHMIEPTGAPDAYLMPGLDEFGHVHRSGFMHLNVPAGHIAELRRLGWAEPHPITRRPEFPDNIVMLYAPRDAAELEVAKRVLYASWRQAGGVGEPAAA